MGHYQHLSFFERVIIQILNDFKQSPQSIADYLGRSKSTIQRELNRLGERRQYNAEEAHADYKAKRVFSRKMRRLDSPELLQFIADKILNHQWSPEQISGWLLKHNPEQFVCFQTIYRTIHNGILDQFNNNRPIKKKLRRKGKRYKSRKFEKRGKIKINHIIHERPKEVEKRKRIGDWEIDTIIGKNSQCCVLTVIERKSRFLRAHLLYNKTSDDVQAAISNLLADDIVYTITSDQGKEFAKYPQAEKDLGVIFYFADPHSPWQKGAIENANGLLREYIPKGFDMTKITNEDVRRFVDELNLRPRKCLGFKTPFEVYQEAAHLQ